MKRAIPSTRDTQEYDYDGEFSRKIRDKLYGN